MQSSVRLFAFAFGFTILATCDRFRCRRWQYTYHTKECKCCCKSDLDYNAAVSRSQVSTVCCSLSAVAVFSEYFASLSNDFYWQFIESVATRVSFLEIHPNSDFCFRHQARRLAQNEKSLGSSHRSAHVCFHFFFQQPFHHCVFAGGEQVGRQQQRGRAQVLAGHPLLLAQGRNVPPAAAHTHRGDRHRNCRRSAV